MILTEEEAKTKWCPFARINDDIAGGVHNRCGPGTTLDCIGSACMAWRHLSQAKDLPVGMNPAEPGWEKDGPERGHGGAVTHRQQWKRTAGFCGLAGQP